MIASRVSYAVGNESHRFPSANVVLNNKVEDA